MTSEPSPRMTQAQLRLEKATALAVATEVLSNRVQSLADVVQTNNNQMMEFRKELNQKPDDAEVQFISGLAKEERRRHLQYAIATGVISALFAGAIAYAFAEREIRERTRQANIACERNNVRAEVNADIYDDVKQIIRNEPVSNRLEAAANELRKTIADCDALHPLSAK